MNTKPKKKRRKGFWHYVSVESPLDERQELISTKIQVEGTSIALALIAVNTAIMDYFYKWCEKYSMTVVLLVVISGIYDGQKGCERLPVRRKRRTFRNTYDIGCRACLSAYAYG